VDAILDAASILFAERGFDAVTMEAIAARSETAIGSLYQFFPSKRSVFEAIAERSLERTRATFDALSGAAAELPWEQLLDAMIDGFALLHAADPAFRAVIANFHLYGLYADADTALHALIVDEIAKRLRGIAPHLPPKRRALVAEMVVTTAASLLYLSQRHEPALARAMREESKRMLRGYVEGAIAR
jgi:AcrR family transcriptional regulator